MDSAWTITNYGYEGHYRAGFRVWIEDAQGKEGVSTWDGWVARRDALVLTNREDYPELFGVGDPPEIPFPDLRCEQCDKPKERCTC